jgi:hypothetical protein
MPRRPRHQPLHVLMNNRLVGHLHRAASGAAPEPVRIAQNRKSRHIDGDLILGLT